MGNYLTDYTGQKLYDGSAKSTYWVYKIPKGNNIMQQGYSDYYDIHKLRHTEDHNKLEAAKQSVDYLASKHGATLCINGVPYSDHGFHGVNIYNGEIRNEITGISSQDGWNTLAIDDNGDFKYFNPKVTAKEILSQGYNTAFDIMQPLLINGQEPSDDIKYMWGKAKWETDREPRSVIAQDKSKQYYYFMVFNGRAYNEQGFTYADLARICKEQGCYEAHALDGGGSTELVVEGKKINYDIENGGKSRRLSPQVLYVGQALEDATFKGMITRVGENADLNKINKSGVYWAYNYTPNAPGNPGGRSYGIVHFQISDNDAMQVAFPFTSDKGYHTKIRRTIGIEQYSPWVDL